MLTPRWSCHDPMIGTREVIAKRSSGLARFTIRRGLAPWTALPRFARSRAGERFCAELRARKARAGERAEGVVTSREIRSFSW
jgi:hypothetical protein